MFRIGVFAHLGEVSVRTLRFYDKRGLIKPACTDAQTGYRYYTAEQLPCLLRIIALRDLGFSLDEIATALHQPLAPEQFTALLTAKWDEVNRRLRRDTEILARIEARLADMTEKDTLIGTKHEVKIKSISPILVATARTTIPTCECGVVNKAVRRLFDELFVYIAQQGGMVNGSTFDRWLDEEGKNADMMVEACIPVATPLVPSGDLHTYELPAVEAAAWTIYQGAFDDGLNAAHRAVVEWIGANGYKINGPDREVYRAYDPNGDPALWVTEVQYPVAAVTD